MNVNKVLDAMLEYQKINNVENECITNATIMYDFLRGCGMKDIKIKSVIVIGTRNKIPVMVQGHLVVDIGDDLLECSYDVSIIEDAGYFDNVGDVFNVITNIPSHKKKEIITKAFKFMNIANDINNGKFCIISRENYHGQLDYIEKKCNIKFSS